MVGQRRGVVAGLLLGSASLSLCVRFMSTVPSVSVGWGAGYCRGAPEVFECEVFLMFLKSGSESSKPPTLISYPGSKGKKNHDFMHPVVIFLIV